MNKIFHTFGKLQREFVSIENDIHRLVAIHDRDLTKTESLCAPPRLFIFGFLAFWVASEFSKYIHYNHAAFKLNKFTLILVMGLRLIKSSETKYGSI